MNQLASIATALFSWGTLIAQVIIILASLLLISVILKRPTNYLHHLSKKTADHAFLFGFVISLVVLFASLLYSNVVGFAPCELCWWQRVFFFPQVILFGIAFYNEKISKVQDEMVFLYSLVLSFIGAMVALFQYYGRMFNTAILNTCAVEGVSCAKVFFISFGYITMPMMSLTAYLVLILLYFFRRHHAKKKM